MSRALFCRRLARGARWLTFCVVGCGPREVTWERAGIQYTKRVDDPTVSADVLDDLIRHRDVIGEYLQLQSPPGSVLKYRKFQDRQDIAKRGHCSAVSASCYFDQFGVESKQALDGHELIHAYTAHLGTKPKIVEEGLAQALSCEHPTIGSVDVSVEMGWSNKAWQSPFFRDIDTLYRAGAAFVAYVLQTHGGARFMEFYARLAAEDELAAASAKFEAVLGSPLEQVWNAALANRSADRACVYPLRCAEPPITPEFATYRSDGLSLLTVIPEQSMLRDWRLGTCDTTPLSDADLDRSGAGFVGTGESSLALGAGRYWLSRESVTRTTQRLTDVLGREHRCAALQPLVLSERERLVAVTRESLGALARLGEGAVRADPWILRAKFDSPDGRVGVECSPNVRVEICEACDYTTCQVACETAHPSVANGNAVITRGDAVLRVHLQDAAGFWVRLRREKQRTKHL